MKRIITLVFVALLCGVDVNAQRPVGDTIAYGGGGEYWYDTAYTNGSCAYYRYMSYKNGLLDDAWTCYSLLLRMSEFQNSQTTSWVEFYHQYPDLASYCAGRYIRGQEFTAASEELMVVGLAVCPTFVDDSELSWLLSNCEWYFSEDGNWIHVVDTTMAGRLTEYVQLYTFEGGTPQLLAQGGWRFEHPHRYMLFPNWYYLAGNYARSVPVLQNETIVAPLYEVMFDTAVLLDKPTFMLAGTHNNNGAVWTDTCSDRITSVPRLCYEHRPTAYSSSTKDPSNPLGDGHQSDWIKYGSYPWYNVTDTSYYFTGAREINIFPILDTLFGTPCAAVTGLDTAGVDSVWATLMWSADARQHDWEVWYRPTGDTVDGGAVVTVAVPTVTLTELVPGTEYSVAVRGRCDIDNYSPWSDTLLFTTTQDTTEVIDTTQTQGIQRLGNLDRFTRIMPNPASEVVNVLSSYRLESIAVYDLTGRLLLEQPAEGISAVVKVGMLPRGTYIMAIRTQQGVATKKLVVRGD